MFETPYLEIYLRKNVLLPSVFLLDIKEDMARYATDAKCVKVEIVLNLRTQTQLIANLPWTVHFDKQSGGELGMSILTESIA